VTSGILLCLWLLFIQSIRGTFQDAHGVDPLAMITTLYPGFWILLGGYAVLCFFTVYYRLNDRFLHQLLLCELALILFGTPFLLSGFSWSPDSLYHGGIAAYIPDIFRGASLPFSSYAASYPLSFITTYLVEAITGLTIFQYSLYVYPVLSIIAFTLLAYRFIARLIGSSQAMVALLLALPALHFLEPHVSPYSFGTILVLIALIALTSTSRRMRALFFLSSVALVVTHPISPLSLGIYLGTALLIQFFEQRWARSREPDSTSIMSNMSWGLVLLLGIVWLIWTLYWAALNYGAVDNAIAKIISLRFLQDLSLATGFTGGGFIYGTIQLLSLVIYGLVGIFDLAVFLVNLRNLRSGKTDRYLILKLFFTLSSILFAGYSYLLFLGTGEHVLLGRGLLFFIVNSSIAFTLQLYQNHSNLLTHIKLGALFALILVLFITFPVAAYSKEAYNTHTPTSGAGLAFIGTHLDLSRNSLSMAADRQLAAYSDMTQGLLLAPYPPNLTEVTPDYIALRINSYFLISMRHDLSFTNNTFTQLSDTLEAASTYNKIYTNNVFDIYANTRID
jgi:hypothetical protein